MTLLSLKTEEDGIEQRNVGDLQKLEKAKKWVIPNGLQKRIYMYV